MRRLWNTDVTPDRAEVGATIDRTTVEEVCQLLGHEPADVLGVLMAPDRVDVMTTGGPGNRGATILHRHVVR